MKTLFKLAMSVVIAVALNACSSTSYISDNTPADDQSTETVTYQRFYDDLSPYGRWVDYPGYGFVWSPSVIDFQPYYSNGFWASTNMGWNWNSGYSWGWAPFHYGRWFYETGYGWMWLPGYEWAPAWVAWRNNASYYGWAPLGPGMHLGVSVAVNIPYEHWNFVDPHHIMDHHVNNYIIDNSKRETIYNNTTIINNYNYTNNKKIVYSKGPAVKDVEKVTGQKITPYIVKDHNIPVENNNLEHQQSNVKNQKDVSNAVNTNVKKREIDVYKPQVRVPKDNEIIKPQKSIPYKELPHDNGQRGTWAIPDHPKNQSPVNQAPIRRNNEVRQMQREQVRSISFYNPNSSRPVNIDRGRRKF